MAAIEEKTSLLERSSESSKQNINKAPQDFVVQGGATYKVVRKSYDKQTAVPVIQGRITPTSFAATQEVATLRTALDEAEVCISRHAARIEELERYLLANSEKLGGTAVLRETLGIINKQPSMQQQAAAPHEFTSINSNSTASGGIASNINNASGKPRLGLAARRRADASQSNEYDLTLNEIEKGPHPHSVFTQEADQEKQEKDQEQVHENSLDLTTPTNAGSELYNTTTLRRSMSDGAVQDAYDMSGSTSTSSTKGPPKGLAARLALGSEERRRMSSMKRMSSSEKLSNADTVGRSLTGSSSGKSKSNSQSQSRMDASDNGAAIGSDVDNDDFVSKNSGDASNGSDSRPGSRDALAAAASATLALDTPKLSRSSSARSASSTGNADSPLFMWSQPEDIRDAGSSSSSTPKLHIFVAHDNPQLGNTVRMHLRTVPSGHMDFMMETKYFEAGKELTCFIVGDMCYSGPFEGIENSCIDDARDVSGTKMQRGSLCLVCTGMRGYKADIKQYPTRPTGEIVELDLAMGLGSSSSSSGSKIGTKSRALGAHEFVLDTQEQLRTFFKPCTGRVDFILDPSHTDTWYPYWEGKRKMAPQFRSKGIGYIRLGDDMSNYGSAFLSLDAGFTFLDNGATSIVDLKDNNHNGAFSSTYPGGAASSSTPLGVRQNLFSSARTDSRGSQRSGTGAADDFEVDVAGGSMRRSGSNTGFADTHSSANSPYQHSTATAGAGDSRLSARELHVRQSEVQEILVLLREPELKWGARVQHLQRLRDLGDSFSVDAFASAGGSVQEQADCAARCAKGTTELISVLTDTVLRQNNPQVLRTAVSCLRTVAASTSVNPSCGVAWRQLILETFHLLRAAQKPVYEEAKDTLEFLHTSSTRGKIPHLTLTHLSPMINDIFAGPRGKGTPRSGASSSDKASSGGAANTKNVVLWFTNAVQQELSAGMHAFATIHTPEFAPSCYERIDTSTILTRCKHLLQHREDATRDASVSMIASIVSLDVVQHSTDLGGMLQLINQASQFFKSFETAAVADSAMCLTRMETHLNNKMMSDKCASVIQEVAKSSPRIYEKFLPVLVKQLEQCSAVLKSSSGGGNILTSGNVGGRNNLEHNVRDRYTAAPSSRGSSREAAGSREGGSRGGQRGITASPNTTTATTTEGLVKNRPPLAQSLKVRTPSTGSLTGLGSGEKPMRPPSADTSLASPAARLRSPNTMPPSSPVDLTALKQRINDQWFEAKLVLRVVPNTDTAWTSFRTNICKENVDSFTNTLQTVAEQSGMVRGKLLRVVLPFDENTSSNDQAMAGMSEDMANNGIGSPRVLSQLREQATGLRKTIRVKMADEADLRQALMATNLLQTFLKDVEVYAKETGKSPANIIGTLE